jgi:xylulose-5-phosphate/fructose-6-phosphate phosphoketolase
MKTCARQSREHGYEVHFVEGDDPTVLHQQFAALDAWMRSYHPESLFDANGRLAAELADLASRGRRRMGPRAAALTAECRVAIEQAATYAREHFEDPPEIRDWVWGA